MLALIGGTLGVLTAQWVVQVFVTLAGTQLPRAATVHIDARVVLFFGAVSLIVGIGCGLWPLLRMRNRELVPSEFLSHARAGGIFDHDGRVAHRG